jgi:hypothetical protein
LQAFLERAPDGHCFGGDFRMGAVMQGVVSLNIGQFLLGLAQMLVDFQIENDTGAFAFGIGEKLLCFGD